MKHSDKSKPEGQEIHWEFLYSAQFKWLKETRSYLYRMVRIASHKRILEVGCSTALVTEELSKKLDASVIGLDKNYNILHRTKNRNKNLKLVCGDVYQLPFKKNIFDTVITQFFLLWLTEPINALSKIKETIKSNGWFIAAGEPDYGGRIDFPDSVDYASYISKNLKTEGADPFIGRKLEYIFQKVNLQDIKWGLASIPFGLTLSEKNMKLSSNFLKNIATVETTSELKRLLKVEKHYIQKKMRAYFTPVFYCIGRKK